VAQVDVAAGGKIAIIAEIKFAIWWKIKKNGSKQEPLFFVLTCDN